jgi:hypothetical protein
MFEGSAPKLPRVTLAAFPENYALPGKPSGASTQVADAHRQTGFLLADELALFERAMNVQLRMIAHNAKLRAAPAAALFSLWSRTFACLSDACMLMCGGSYASCPPLLRTALDAVAVQRSLIADGFAEYEEWLGEAISQDKTRQALAIDLGRYKAASALIGDPQLGVLYRLLMDLSMPHFGSSVLLSGPESGLRVLSLAFADNAFHLGWAELISGWTLLVAWQQLETARSAGVLKLDGSLASDCDAVANETRRLLSSRRRCYVEDDGGRFVFMNFRRTASGQPKRIVLG